MPVPVPASVEITEKGQMLTVKGPKGSLEHTIHEMVELKREDAELNFGARNESSQAKALAGTTRSIVHNMAKPAAGILASSACQSVFGSSSR